MKHLIPSAVSAALVFTFVDAQSKCKLIPGTRPNYTTPSMADGYEGQLIANDLSDPRGIKFDSQGALLVVEVGVGITALTLDYSSGDCISVKSKKTVVSNPTLNHGIELSRDGSTLYASNPRDAYSWSYDPQSQKATDQTTLITNMSNTDHVTRTLLLPRSAPDLLVVARGSTSNIDPMAEELSSGHSEIKAFNLTNITGSYDFPSEGLLLGWGLRNDVGVDEEPTTGGIYSVENSVDEMTRNGQDIHNTNPAEELNFLGYLNGKSSSNQGRNFGYPTCYTAWDVDTIPGFKGDVGQQFAIGRIGSNNSDAMCSEKEVQDARIAFHPHMAPLDILFNDDGSAAWVTFHGSWDSDVPVGFKLSMVEFKNGEPVEPSTSKTAAIDIMWNKDITQCYKIGKCFRPVGLDWDSKGRLFMSSDETGEVYVIMRSNGSPTSSAGSKTTGTTSSSPSSSSGVASTTSMSGLAVIFGLLAYIL